MNEIRSKVKLEKVVILIIRINTRDIMSIILFQYPLYFVRVCAAIIINYFLYYLLYSMIALLQRL